MMELVKLLENPKAGKYIRVIAPHTMYDRCCGILQKETSPGTWRVKMDDRCLIFCQLNEMEAVEPRLYKPRHRKVKHGIITPGK